MIFNGNLENNFNINSHLAPQSLSNREWVKYLSEKFSGEIWEKNSRGYKFNKFSQGEIWTNNRKFIEAFFN